MEAQSSHSSTDKGQNLGQDFLIRWFGKVVQTANKNLPRLLGDKLFHSLQWYRSIVNAIEAPQGT